MSASITGEHTETDSEHERLSTLVTQPSSAGTNGEVGVYSVELNVEDGRRRAVSIHWRSERDRRMMAPGRDNSRARRLLCRARLDQLLRAFLPLDVGPAVLRRINDYLVRWAMWRYKPIRRSPKKAAAFLGRIVRSDPDLFAHWKLIAIGGG